MTPDDFFMPWEAEADKWSRVLELIKRIDERAGDRQIVWRGVRDTAYALHSSAYRLLVDREKVAPDEDKLQEFERSVLKQAQQDWRFANLSALEIFAHVQHFGGPTRLLDVTYNPLIALWFAVEQEFDSRKKDPRPDTDGRLFAFDVTGQELNEKDLNWFERDLPWEGKGDKWQTEAPLLWKPPNFNPRIAAQNAAFLLSGVPQVKPGGNTRFRVAPGNGTKSGTWKIDEVRQATSVIVNMKSLQRRPQKKSSPLTFVVRIKSEAKPEIRQMLRDRFGYSAGSIYPDLYGLAQYSNHF